MSASGVFQVIITDYGSHTRDIRHIREEVFVREQSVPRELEYDGRDDRCMHAIAFENEVAVGTGRMDLEQGGKVGRVAVLKRARRRGVGSQIMQAFESHALANKLPRIWFHAQHSAVPFYQQLGYKIVSDEFQEAGIVHVVMEKRIP